MTNMQAIKASAFVKSAIMDIFTRMHNQLDAIDNETGKPVLNSKTKEKLTILHPFLQAVNAGEHIDIETQQNILLHCVHVSTNMTSKLKDVNALSSAASVNPTCLARSKDCKSICHSCFAFLTFERYNDLEQAAIINFIVLNSMVFDRAAWNEIPIPTSNGLFRIEAFGDVASAVQAANFINLAYTHPYLLNIGTWSKNLGFWAVAFNALGKPENMVFNASSPVLNEQLVIKPDFKWFIDHVFTVYDANTALANDVNINCGERVCKHCKRCYTKGNEQAVNEILKQESKRYYKAIGKTFTGRK